MVEITHRAVAVVGVEIVAIGGAPVCQGLRARVDPPVGGCDPAFWRGGDGVVQPARTHLARVVWGRESASEQGDD